MAKDLAGATIISEKVENEAGAKLAEGKKSAKFEKFIEVKRKKELESIKPLSSDLEIIENVDEKQLKQLQADKRLYGWDDKTKTALVLKLAFVDKKKKLKDKGE